MEWIFALSFSLVMVVLLAIGVLTVLLPPDKYVSVMRRVWRVAPRPRNRLQDVERRLVGILLAYIGLSGLIAVIQGARKRVRPALPALPSPRGIEDVTSAWLAFGVGVALSIGGVWFLVNPRPVLDWSEKTFYPRENVPVRTLQIWRTGFRVTGALMLYSSIMLFRLSWSLR